MPDRQWCECSVSNAGRITHSISPPAGGGGGGRAEGGGTTSSPPMHCRQQRDDEGGGGGVACRLPRWWGPTPLRLLPGGFRRSIQGGPKNVAAAVDAPFPLAHSGGGPQLPIPKGVSCSGGGSSQIGRRSKRTGGREGYSDEARGRRRKESPLPDQQLRPSLMGASSSSSFVGGMHLLRSIISRCSMILHPSLLRSFLCL